MHYHHLPQTDKERLKAIITATEANKLKLHNVKLPLVLDAEAGFFISWFENEMPRFKLKGEIMLSELMREKADSIIRRLWNEIGRQLNNFSETEQINYAKHWGINYIDVRFKRLELPEQTLQTFRLQ